MSAAPMPVGWAGLEETLPAAPAPLPIPPSLPESCTLQSIPYTLYSILRIDEGESITPMKRAKAFEGLLKEAPGLRDLYDKHVTPRINVAPAKHAEAAAALVGHLHRAVSGSVAEQLATIEWLLNQEVYNGRNMGEHLKNMKGLWDEHERHYLAGLPASDREIYDALASDPDAQAAFRIMRDLAIEGKGECYMGCDQLGHRVGISGAAGWRLLQRLGPGGLGIIAKIKDGMKWGKGVKPTAATWQWRLPLPQAVPQT